MVDQTIEVCPCFEFSDPVADGAEWHEDKERTVDTINAHFLAECKRLNGFTKTHLVGENTISRIEPAEGQPINAFQLVFAYGVVIIVNPGLFHRCPFFRSRFWHVFGVNVCHGVELVESRYFQWILHVGFEFPGGFLVGQGLPFD